MDRFGLSITVSDNKAELKAALWRLPPLDDTEPPLNQNDYGSPVSGEQHAASLNKLCSFEGEHKNIRKYVSCLLFSFIRLLFPTRPY